MHRLMNERVQEHSLTPLQDLAQSSRVQSRIPWGAAAVFLAVTLTTAALLAQVRSTSALKKMDAPTPALPVPANQQATSTRPSEPPADDFIVTQASVPSKGEVVSGAHQNKAAARAASLMISVEPFQVRSEDHFAEIRLQRNLLQKNASFTWWTEPATAKPNVDYVPEAVAIQTFPAGYHATRLYVRLMPQPLRSQRSYFYIVVAQVGGPHQAPGAVTRRQIWLPSSSNLQAKR
jgi:hypothetical protein